jgi:diguanylate cyclase (GGDEF)-like protein/PAS domain S-box-containing protein
MAKNAAKKTAAPGGLSLKESELRYRRLFESAQDGILILDAETGMITDVNPFLIQLLGYSQEEFIKRKLWEVGAFRDIEASREAFKALQKDEYIRYKDLPLRSRDGKLIQVEFVSNVYQAGDRKVIQCNIRDITERQQAHNALVKSKAELRRQSVHDHLTGLFNRRYMEEILERELLRAARHKYSVGVILMDVDGFKQFNDTHGHPAGDAILKELGRLLRGIVHHEDMPTRYGGDEFIVVLPDASRTVTYQRAELICDHAKNIRLPFDGKTLEGFSLSIGVAVFPEDGATGAELLAAADAALYRAKRGGRGQVVAAG